MKSPNDIESRFFVADRSQISMRRLFAHLGGISFCLCLLLGCQADGPYEVSASAATNGSIAVAQVSHLTPQIKTESIASDFEGTAHGFPVLRSLDGAKLADGEFSQRLEGELLHVSIRYEFSPVHSIEERATFRQKPALIQEAWSWQEVKDGKSYRTFQIDFASGKASAEKRTERGMRRWSRVIKLERERCFAGFGFTLAIQRLREQLIQGEKIELQAIGFTPKPQAVLVEISYGGLDQISMSQRTVRGDRFVIHPKIPWIAKLFVHVPDTRIWLINPLPAGFLRWEGPIAEPKDAVIRVDLLPGN